VTASSAEIFVYSLKEQKRGIIIGEKTEEIDGFLKKIKWYDCTEEGYGEVAYEGV